METSTSSPKASPPPIWIMILTASSLIVAVGALYYVLVVRSAPQAPPITELKVSNIQVDDAEEPTNGEPEPQSDQKSVITPLDSEWVLYKNTKFGYAMEFPKNAVSFAGDCEYSTKNGDHSYRPVFKSVPLQILEADESAYVTAQYYYKLTGETVDAGRHYYTACDETNIDITTVTTADKTSYMSPLLVIFANVVDGDAGLEKFIQDNYGTDCKLGSKTDMGNYTAVAIAGISTDETKNCFVNYMYTIRYNPQTNVVVAWNLGQACNFPYPTQDKCQDQTMADSFKFD